MILDYKCFTLGDKSIFEKVKMKPPFQPASNFPDEACFIYVLEGTQQTYSPTDRAKLSKADAILLKCGSYFTEWVESGEYDYCEAIGVHLYPEILKSIYGNEIPNFVRRKVDTSSQTVRVSNNQLIDAFIESILFYFDHPELVDDDLLKLKLKELILLLTKTEKANSIIDIVSGLFTPREVQLKDVIEAHTYSNIGIDQLALLCNLSLSTFKREFQKVYNETPAKYIKVKRLERARQLLKISDQSVSDIAYQCGFADVSHFSNSFKEFYDMSPTDYRVNQ